MPETDDAYVEDSSKVLCRSAMTPESNKENSVIFTFEEFIPAITQQIPDEHFQMVRYDAWDLNMSKRERTRQGSLGQWTNHPQQSTPFRLIAEEFSSSLSQSY